MKKQPVRLLQLVEVRNHLGRIPIQIFLVVRGAIRLELQNRQHVHVVDPVARFCREPIRLRILPLPIGPRLPVRQVLRVFRLHADLERNDAEDGVVDVMADGNAASLGAPRHQWLKLVNQLCTERVIVRELGKGQRAIPCAYFAIKNGAVALVRAGDEVFGNPLAYILR